MNQFILPPAFCSRIHDQWPEEAKDLLTALEEEARSSVHLHPEKGADLFQNESVVPWFVRGRVLSSRPSFTLDPLLHAGAYYVQESSSMYIHRILEQLFPEDRNILALDACAAPGGKSILISSFLGEHGFLVSNEVNPIRNSILQENLTKWGIPNICVTKSDTSAFGKLTGMFDLILIDAPCGGEGMFRKDKASRESWNQGLPAYCSERQHNILHHIAPSLKNGGYLIYSTCTFSPLENYDPVLDLLNSGEWEIADDGLPEYPGLFSDKHAPFAHRYFLPHRVSGEGFFVTVLRKTISSGKSQPNKRSDIFRNIAKDRSVLAASFVSNPDKLLSNDRGEVFLSNADASLLSFLYENLKLTMPGLLAGTFKGRDFVPGHGLAMSNYISPSVSKTELSLESALRYLRLESTTTDSDETGWKLVSYLGRNLGWIKALGHRVNNYYPPQWRIRTS